MKLTFWGAGGIGGLAAAYLARAGHEVEVVDVNASHVAAISRSGLQVVGCRGEFAVSLPARTPDQVEGPLRAVLLACKSQHTAAAMEQIAPRLAPDGFVVSLQNGMNEEVIAEAVGSHRTVGAIPDYTGAYLDPGVLEHTAEGPTYFGELDGQSTPRVQALQRIFSDFVPTYVLHDIWGRLWAKQVYGNQVIMSALVDAPIEAVWGNPRWKRVAVAIVQEGLRVTDAYGVELPEGPFFKPALYRPGTPEETRRLFDSIDAALDILVEHRKQQEAESSYKYVKRASGIWWDIVYRKRKSEVEYLAGTMVRHAEARGVAIPLIRRLAEMIYAIEDGKRELGWQNLEELEAEAVRLGYKLPSADQV